MSGSATLPAPYDAWIGAVLESAPIPDESRATCHACAMTTEHGGVPDERAFAPNLKCCTFHPDLANFRVGAILDDERAGRARAWIVARIARHEGVTPLALFRTAAEQTLHLRTNQPGSFGRSKDALCPHYVTEDGTCGIWAHREAVCSTFYCRFERGAVGSLFWGAVRQLLGTIERTVSLRAVLALVPGGDVCELLQHVSRDRAIVERFTAKERAALWGAWSGREVDFFREAARLVAAMSWADVLAENRAELEVHARIVRRRFARLSTPMPSSVRTGNAIVGFAADGAARVSNAAAPFDSIDVPLSALRRADKLAADGAPIEPEDRELVRSLLDYGYLAPR